VNFPDAQLTIAQLFPISSRFPQECSAVAVNPPTIASVSPCNFCINYPHLPKLRNPRLFEPLASVRKRDLSTGTKTTLAVISTGAKTTLAVISTGAKRSGETRS